MNDGEGNQFLREEYLSRINRVIDFIERNLDGELQLRTLSKVANFSPFHFHRIFRAIVGEPLFQFVQRLRLERAALQLISNPKKPITRIAYDCGFGSSASFARAFREYHGESPSAFRASNNAEKSKKGIMESKKGKPRSKVRKDTAVSGGYSNGSSKNYIRRNTMEYKESGTKALKVEVRDFPDMHVAYVRHIGPYKGDEALFQKQFEKLFKWAGARGLLNFPETKVLSVYHDDPEITDENRLRTSMCITVPENTAVDGGIGKMVIPGGKYAAAWFEISADEYQEAWDSLCGAWLPESGFQPDDRPSFEISLNDPREHPQHKHIVEICIPVKPL